MWDILGFGLSGISILFWVIGNHYSYNKDYNLSIPTLMISTAFGLLGIVVGVGHMLGYA